jgi:hypothetical protein
MFSGGLAVGCYDSSTYSRDGLRLHIYEESGVVLL